MLPAQSESETARVCFAMGFPVSDPPGPEHYHSPLTCVNEGGFAGASGLRPARPPKSRPTASPPGRACRWPAASRYERRVRTSIPPLSADKTSLGGVRRGWLDGGAGGRCDRCDSRTWGGRCSDRRRGGHCPVWLGSSTMELCAGGFVFLIPMMCLCLCLL